QRLEQLHQVGTVAHLQQHLAHLVAAEDVLAMHFTEAHRLVRRHVRFQLARPHRHGHMIEKQKTRDLFQFVAHDTNSATTCPDCTLSPAFTLTAASLPETGAVIFVSIFMASSTSRTSPT